MSQKVNFYSSTPNENGMILVLTASGMPGTAVALSLTNGMTEEMVIMRVRAAFRTLENGVVADKGAIDASN